MLNQQKNAKVQYIPVIYMVSHLQQPAEHPPFAHWPSSLSVYGLQQTCMYSVNTNSELARLKLHSYMSYVPIFIIMCNMSDYFFR